MAVRGWLDPGDESLPGSGPEHPHLQWIGDDPDSWLDHSSQLVVFEQSAPSVTS